MEACRDFPHFCGFTAMPGEPIFFMKETRTCQPAQANDVSSSSRDRGQILGSHHRTEMKSLSGSVAMAQTARVNEDFRGQLCCRKARGEALQQKVGKGYIEVK